MSTENLNNKESWKKLRELVDDIKVSMMVTGFNKKPINAIPMRSKKIDQDGNIWFLSLKTSEHNREIEKDKNVQLLYSKPADNEFLSVFGSAEITRDKAILEELYTRTTDNWFDGIDDPNITAIKVTPREAYYWDSKDNKYMTLLKLGVGAVTGNKQDIGEKGKMNL